MVVRVGQYEELRQKVEIGQPACRELEVPGIALAFLLCDQRPHRLHRPGDGDRIAATGQDGADRGFGAHGKTRIARDDAGAGQRHLLPDLGLAGVIGLEPCKLRRGRALVAGRPQPHVDLVERTAPRRHRQRRDKPLGEAHMPGDGIERLAAVAGVGLLRAVVEQDQVEVGCRRQFARA